MGRSFSDVTVASSPSDYYGPGRGGPVSRIDFTKTPVSPVSRLKYRQSIGDTDSLGGLKVSILRPQSIDFSGAVSRIDFKKSAVSSIANNPLPGPYGRVGLAL